MNNCEQCGDTELNVRSFDTSGRLFCSLQHFKQFYEQKWNTYHDRVREQANSGAILNGDEIAQQEHSLHEYYKPDGPFDRMSEDQQTQLILSVTRRIELLKMEQIAQLKAQSRRQLKLDTEKIAELKKYGANDPQELQKKRLSSVEKAIVQARKMNFDQDGIIAYVKLMCQTMGLNLSDNQIRMEMENLK